MTCRFVRYTLMTAVAVVAAFALTRSVEAQAPAPARGAAQQNEAAPVPTPRTPDGKPDLSGFWGGGGGGGEDGGASVDEKGNLVVLNKSRGCHPGMKICTAPVNQSNDSTFMARFDANRPTYKPEYWARVQELDFNSNTVAPYFKCQPAGVPRMGPPTKILQTKDEVVFLYAQQGSSPTDFRIIPTDGRKHDPIRSQDLLFYGDAVGKWEGDTLIVDAVGFNDLTWLGPGGYFHSDQMTVVERFRREGNTLHYQATVTDPEVLVEPWVMNERVLRLNTGKSAVIAEQNPCEEHSLGNLVGRIHH
jgi:hypothetical protein